MELKNNLNKFNIYYIFLISTYKFKYFIKYKYVLYVTCECY